MKKLFFLVLLLIFGLSLPALATPTFQVYIEGAVADSIGQDLNTWFTRDSTFTLVIVGDYHLPTNGNPTILDLTDVTLAVSVPDGQTGAISITPLAGTSPDPFLLTVKTSALDGYFNPNADADEDILTDVLGIDGYDTKNFLPTTLKNMGDEHYPFQDKVSDFLLFGLDSFSDPDGTVPDYCTIGGITYDVAGSWGQIKTYTVTVTGFSSAHFDVYGYEIYDDLDKGKVFTSTWDDSPECHDATCTIPAPGAVLLGSIGVGLVGWLRSRRMI